MSLRAALGGALPEHGEDPRAVVDALAAAVEPGLVAMGSPRYFGFVIGGSVPAALAADWLTATWDQNVVAVPRDAGRRRSSRRSPPPGSSTCSGLPAGTSVGFTTGATMANFTALAAARHAVLRGAGWDVEEDGLIGAPPIHVRRRRRRPRVDDRTRSGWSASGAGGRSASPSDDEGRMRPAELRRVLAELPPGPTIVCAQAGEVNTGAFDPLAEIADVRRRAARDAGSTSTARSGCGPPRCPRSGHGSTGIERADSWSTDAHKWLNVPYDSGLVFVRDVAAHRAAMGVARRVPAARARRRARPDATTSRR